ncbi:MAG TPA: LON peptidase substrate-binding domain-containing protein [Acidimicrobiales bacterium]|nr:LON peptidase substrate-binding domain-containing protein [Acidimicrobiales bacterium]
MTVSGLPMFPLGTVLFPHALLPLHVFEPRYQSLVRHCLAGDGQLGVVLIERGSEVGGGDVRFPVGTRARLLEAVPLGDGRWYLVVVGTDRIQVTRWLPEDPFPRADVELLPDEDGTPPDSGRDAVERLLRRALALKAELGEPAAPATGPLDDRIAVAAWQAAAMAPLGPVDAQRLLEAAGTGERLRLLEAMLDEEVAVLAHRVAEAG